MKFATVFALSWYVETRATIYTPRDHYLLAMIDRAECVYKVPGPCVNINKLHPGLQSAIFNCTTRI